MCLTSFLVLPTNSHRIVDDVAQSALHQHTHVALEPYLSLGGSDSTSKPYSSHSASPGRDSALTEWPSSPTPFLKPPSSACERIKIIHFSVTSILLLPFLQVRSSVDTKLATFRRREGFRNEGSELKFWYQRLYSGRGRNRFHTLKSFSPSGTM